MLHFFLDMVLTLTSSTQLLVCFVLEVSDTVFPFVAHMEQCQQNTGITGVKSEHAGF